MSVLVEKGMCVCVCAEMERMGLATCEGRKEQIWSYPWGSDLRSHSASWSPDLSGRHSYPLGRPGLRWEPWFQVPPVEGSHTL